MIPSALAVWLSATTRGRSSVPAIAGSRAAIDSIETAQREGTVTDRMAPVDVLALLMAIAQMWTTFAPEFQVFLAGHTREGRRKLVTDAVEAVLR